MKNHAFVSKECGLKIIIEFKVGINNMLVGDKKVLISSQVERMKNPFKRIIFSHLYYLLHNYLCTFWECLKDYMHIIFKY